MVHIFDKVFIFNEHTDYVRHIEKVDERRYCTGGDDGLVVVYDVENCKKLYTLRGHTLPIAAMHSMSYIKSERNYSIMKYILITSSADHQIIIWDLDTGSKLEVFSGQERLAKCLLSIPKYPGHFISGGEKIVIWTIDGFIDSCIPSATEDVTFMVTLQDKYVIVAVDNYLVVTHLKETDGHFRNPKAKIIFGDKSLIILKPHREVVTCLAKIDDESFMSGSLDGAITHWSASTLECIGTYNFVDRYLGEMKVYPYSVQCLYVLEEEFLIVGLGRSFSLYHAASESPLITMENAHEGKITHVDVIYDGQFIVTCSENIKLWRVLCGDSSLIDAPLHTILKMSSLKMELVQMCSLHTASIMKCLPAGRDKFISCGSDSQVVLWMDDFAEEQKIFNMQRRLMSY